MPPAAGLVEFRTSPTAPDVAFVPTNTVCTGSERLYLHGFWLPPFLHLFGLPTGYP